MSWEGLRRLKRTSTEGTLTIVEDEDERRKIKDEEENRKTNAMEGKPLQIAAHSAESIYSLFLLFVANIVPQNR